MSIACQYRLPRAVAEGVWDDTGGQTPKRTSANAWDILVAYRNSVINKTWTGKVDGRGRGRCVKCIPFLEQMLILLYLSVLSKAMPRHPPEIPVLGAMSCCDDSRKWL